MDGPGASLKCFTSLWTEGAAEETEPITILTHRLSNSNQYETFRIKPWAGESLVGNDGLGASYGDATTGVPPLFG